MTILDDYTFTRVRGNRLLEIDARRFDSHPTQTKSQSSGYANYPTIDVGFDFPFCDNSYKTIGISPCGYIVLADSSNYANCAMWYNGLFNDAYDWPFAVNYPYGSLGGGIPEILVAPWFTVPQYVTSTLEDSGLDSGQQSSVRSGFSQSRVVNVYDRVNYGFRSCLDTSTGMKRRIVRWYLYAQNVSTVVQPLSFEVVLCEDGEIQFRYDPFVKSTKFVSGATSTAIAIFSPDSFRDLTQNIGYPDFGRQPHVLGGYGPSSWVDPANSTPYASNLTAVANWPGTDSGYMFSFRDLSKRRRILPRVESKKSKNKTDSGPFNDNSCVNVGLSAVVNYPTTLQRFYNADSDENVRLKQDLYVGGIELTGSVSRRAAESFLGDERIASDTRYYQFNESSTPEQSDLTFFATGSSPAYLGTDLSARLSSKEVIRYQFPVTRETVMQPQNACMYYYDKFTRQWIVPPSAQKDIQDPVFTINYYSSLITFPEDARFFGPLGNLVSSGTLDNSLGSQTIQFIGEKLSLDATALPSIGWVPINSQVDCISNYYDNSVQNNPLYRPTESNVFRYEGEKPLLLEKVALDIPACFGQSWFDDVTTVNANYSDVSGPMITFALLRKTATRLDLLCSGTVSHSNDMKQVTARPTISPGNSSNPYIAAFNIIGNPLNAGCVVTSSLSPFTGSVSLHCDVATSNGVLGYLTYESILWGNGTALPYRSLSDIRACASGAISFLKQKNFKLPRNSFEESSFGIADIQSNLRVHNINPFGKSASGFEPSGRSNFGKEFSTSQGIINDGVVKNNSYVGERLSDALTAFFDVSFTPTNLTGSGGYTSSLPYTAVLLIPMTVPLAVDTISPYVLLPGDELVLAVSKHRSALAVSYGTIYVSGSHDVTLGVGQINVSLYGSYLKQGACARFVDKNFVNSREVGSTSAYDDTDVDQYDVEYTSDLVGTYTDTYVTGSLVSAISTGIRNSFVTGSRGVVFSKTNASNKPMPADSPTGSADVVNNPSKAFRLESWAERSVTSRTVRMSSLDERFYDSMTPSFQQMLKVNSANAFSMNTTPVYGVLFNNASLMWTIVKNIGSNYYFNTAFVFLDFSSNNNGISQELNDRHFLKSFPFESKYSSIVRQSSLQEPYQVKHNAVETLSGGTTTCITNGNKKYTFDTIFPFFAGKSTAYNFYNDIGNGPTLGLATSTNYAIMFPADSDLRIDSVPNAGGYATGSCDVTDLSKFLFGFGDLNTVQRSEFGSGIYFGSNHVPDFRDKSVYNHTGCSSCYSPIVRGWKYGLLSALPTYKSAVFRRDKFGQARDMLEQSLDTRYWNNGSISSSPVSVQFLDAAGNVTDPANTRVQNQSTFATSSLPYFDGFSVERTSLDAHKLNTTGVVLSNQNGNLTI